MQDTDIRAARIEALVARLEADVAQAERRCEQIAESYRIGGDQYHAYVAAAESASVARMKAVGARMALVELYRDDAPVLVAADPITASVAEGLIDAEDADWLRARHGGEQR